MSHYLRYMKNITQYLQDEAYFYSMLTMKLALTLFNEKPASLICLKNSLRNSAELWREHKDLIAEQTGLKYKLLKQNAQVSVVLFYDQERLTAYLEQEEIRGYLERRGFEMRCGLDESLEDLRRFFEDGYSHEVGLFLGYPLEDVEAYSRDRDKNCLCRGYWSVYKNIEEKLITFERYRQINEQLAEELSRIAAKDYLLNRCYENDKKKRIYRHRYDNNEVD